MDARPALAVVGLAALLLACPAATVRAPADAAANAAPVSGHLEAMAAILRAEDRRVADAELRAALAHAAPEVRARAVLALGRIRAQEHRADLEAALGDRAAGVRAAAAMGLGLLGDVAATAALVRAAGDRDAEVCARVAEALGRLGDAAAALALERLLSHDDLRVRTEASLAAWRLPDAAFAVGGLIENTRSPDASLRAAAAYALARLSSAGLVPASSGSQPGRTTDADRVRVRAHLVSLASDREAEVRMQVARGLATPITPLEEATIGGLLSDRDPRVRVNAVRSAGFQGARLAPFLMEGLTDTDMLVVWAAVESLGRVRTQEATQVLLQGLRRPASAWLRGVGLDTFASSRPDDAARLALTLVRDPDPRLRAAAARALGTQLELPVEDALDTLLADAYPPARSAAIASIAARDPFDSDLDPVLASGDPVLLATLAEALGAALGRSPDDAELRGAALGRLRAIWESSTTAEMPDARVAAVDAAARAGRAPEARELLLRALDDPDRLVRVRAIEHLRAVHGEDHAARAGAAVERPLSYYRDVLEWAARPHTAVIEIVRGETPVATLSLELDPAAAPLTCWNFAQLAAKGFYDGLPVHRIVPNFVIQDGDPRGDGTGGPGWSIRDELGGRRFLAGTLGMASAGPDTAGSQWFVTHSAQPHLDGRYTAFGRVVSDVAAVGQVLPGDTVRAIRVDAEVSGGGGAPPPAPGS